MDVWLGLAVFVVGPRKLVREVAVGAVVDWMEGEASPGFTRGKSSLSGGGTRQDSAE